MAARDAAKSVVGKVCACAAVAATNASAMQSAKRFIESKRFLGSKVAPRPCRIKVRANQLRNFVGESKRGSSVARYYCAGGMSSGNVEAHDGEDYRVCEAASWEETMFKGSFVA